MRKLRKKIRLKKERESEELKYYLTVGLKCIIYPSTGG